MLSYPSSKLELAARVNIGNPSCSEEEEKNDLADASHSSPDFEAYPEFVPTVSTLPTQSFVTMPRIPRGVRIPLIVVVLWACLALFLAIFSCNLAWMITQSPKASAIVLQKGDDSYVPPHGGRPVYDPRPAINFSPHINVQALPALAAAEPAAQKTKTETSTVTSTTATTVTAPNNNTVTVHKVLTTTSQTLSLALQTTTVTETTALPAGTSIFISTREILAPSETTTHTTSIDGALSTSALVEPASPTIFADSSSSASASYSAALGTTATISSVLTTRVISTKEVATEKISITVPVPTALVVSVTKTKTETATVPTAVSSPSSSGAVSSTTYTIQEGAGSVQTIVPVEPVPQVGGAGLAV
ncbi:hypothetical protein LTS18_009720 [Coniosporium uncinatum]|uniref:Uncharacterized protein n=1 Tax=Coniosporium uncinatum TaxID=93489 RepID=A0ACC3DA50_9PEZI|nr:hypothetical protein LTS18_009720 [Coniosporium uncinatum]